MKMKNYPLLLIFVATAAGAVDITVYNQNLGLVREIRGFKLKTGVNDISLTDVPAQIDATSVHIKSAGNDESFTVLEQNFQYDLINEEKILGKYIGKEIELERFLGMSGDKREVLRGTLLSTSGGRVLQVGKKIYVNPDGNPILPDLPEGLLTKPTLLWKINSKREGHQECEISYLTGGMGWSADYVLVTSPKDDEGEMNAWVTLENTSGASFKDARLKLVAGDINRIRPPVLRRAEMKAMGAAVDESAFAEKRFFEYHLYTLQRRTALLNNETKQIELTSASKIPLKKIFTFEGAASSGWVPRDGGQNKNVAVTLEFKNTKEGGLGLPLPKGRVRVFKKDTDGSQEFIGEDQIDHTAKDEKVRIKVGNAFDLVGERVNTKTQSGNRWSEESWQITLRNHKEEDVTIIAVERLQSWRTWKITESSMKWQRKDAHTIEFHVPVPKGGETVVTYTIRYSW